MRGFDLVSITQLRNGKYRIDRCVDVRAKLSNNWRRMNPEKLRYLPDAMTYKSIDGLPTFDTFAQAHSYREHITNGTLFLYYPVFEEDF